VEPYVVKSYQLESRTKFFFRAVVCWEREQISTIRWYVDYQD